MNVLKHPSSVGKESSTHARTRWDTASLVPGMESSRGVVEIIITSRRLELIKLSFYKLIYTHASHPVKVLGRNFSKKT
jgi:hypothetical protein